MFSTIDRLQDVTGRLTDEVRTLIRIEIELAQAEMLAKAKSAGRAAAYGAVAGVLLFFSVFAFLIAAIWGLGEAVPLWLSALIIGAAFVLLAAIVGLVARRRAKRAAPLFPDAAIESVRTIPEDLRKAAG
jgi:Flp pilus assembly protein TadB